MITASKFDKNKVKELKKGVKEFYELSKKKYWEHREDDNRPSKLMCNTFINLDYKSLRFIDSYTRVIDPNIKEKYA